MLSFNHALVSLRNEHAALTLGDQRIIVVRDNVLLLERSDANDTFLIALNFGHSDQELLGLADHDPVLSTHMDRIAVDAGMLRADEGLILKRR